MLINAGVTDFLDNGAQIVNGVPQRAWLEQFNGLKGDTSWFLLTKFGTAVTNLSKVFDQYGAVPVDANAPPPPGGRAAGPVAGADTLQNFLEELVCQVHRRSAEFQYKFPNARSYAEAVQERTAKKEKRPALAREVRRRR